MKITIAWLEEKKACLAAVDWAQGILGKDEKSLSECLPLMERADWMLWLLWHTKTVNLRQMVWFGCLCGRLSLRHVAAGEDRPRLAYEAAEKWVINPNNETVKAAAGAAAAAEHKKMCSLILKEIEKDGFCDYQTKHLVGWK